MREAEAIYSRIGVCDYGLQREKKKKGVWNRNSTSAYQEMHGSLGVHVVKHDALVVLIGKLGFDLLWCVQVVETRHWIWRVFACSLVAVTDKIENEVTSPNLANDLAKNGVRRGRRRLDAHLRLLVSFRG